ncbi:MAG: vitamin K epoxide reductase family protein [Armatimonadetes bacterium]|nr:vitamin K epoxide reductase family protein [Armatimonadota bacterium]MDE2207018.1 vitamin K epoxide reductase family protein [Armatimonadota bacterium]
MTRKIVNGIALVLSAFGAVLALLLTIEHYSSQVSLPCGLHRGCTDLLKSRFGQLGPLPTAALGVLMYGAILALTIAAMRSRASASGDGAGPDAAIARAERFEMIRAVLAACGFVVSWLLQYAALFVLLGFCPYCFTSAITITIIALVTVWHHFLVGRRITGEQKLLGGVCFFLLAMFGVLFWPVIAAQWHVVHDNTPRPVEILSQTLLPPGTHFLGEPTAKFTLVEFGDYECENCKLAVNTTNSILMQRPTQVRIAFRNLPLPMHPFAKLAARAAEAAGLQHKFWQMHDEIYAHQQDMGNGTYSEANLIGYAKSLNLNIPEFQRDINSQAVRERIQVDMQAAQQMGLDATPSFVLLGPHSTRPWTFAGTLQLAQAMDNPNLPMWKQ